MMGSTHRVWAVAVTTTAGAAVGWPWPQTAIAAAVSTLTAAGAWSPDMDLQGNGALAHRRLMHWWGLPAAAAIPALAATPPGFRWVTGALLLGWVSHLVGDFVFGKASRYRPKGIPFTPTKGHTGLGLDAGGPTEWVTRVLLLPPLIAIAGSYAYHHGQMIP
jgi:hypothetical protein